MMWPEERTRLAQLSKLRRTQIQSHQSRGKPTQTSVLPKRRPWPEIGEKWQLVARKATFVHLGYCGESAQPCEWCANFKILLFPLSHRLILFMRFMPRSEHNRSQLPISSFATTPTTRRISSSQKKESSVGASPCPSSTHPS